MRFGHIRGSEQCRPEADEAASSAAAHAAADGLRPYVGITPLVLLRRAVAEGDMRSNLFAVGPPFPLRQAPHFRSATFPAATRDAAVDNNPAGREDASCCSFRAVAEAGARDEPSACIKWLLVGEDCWLRAATPAEPAQPSLEVAPFRVLDVRALPQWQAFAAAAPARRRSTPLPLRGNRQTSTICDRLCAPWP